MNNLDIEILLFHFRKNLNRMRVVYNKILKVVLVRVFIQVSDIRDNLVNVLVVIKNIVEVKKILYGHRGFLLDVDSFKESSKLRGL